MEEDVFLSAHPSIVRITYVELSADKFPTTVPMVDSNDGSGDQLLREDDPDNSPVLPIILAAAACVIIGAGVTVFWRYSAKG
jgi:hypothetical protein